MRIVPEQRAKIKIGEEFERLAVMGRSFYMKMNGVTRSHVVCECKCGEILVTQNRHLLSQNTQSCGCLNKDRVLEANRTHGESRSKLYDVWQAMRRRCENERDENYWRYGGRGIAVCDEWKEFVPFREWAMASGYAVGLTIERVNNDLGYSAGNCRWATRRDQTRNTRHNRRLTAFGETQLLADWVRDARCVVTSAGLRYRLNRGMAMELALTKTPQGKSQRGIR